MIKKIAILRNLVEVTVTSISHFINVLCILVRGLTCSALEWNAESNTKILSVLT